MSIFELVRRTYRNHKIYGLILDALGNLADEYNYIIGVTDHISLIQGRKKLRFSDIIETINIAIQDTSEDEEYLLAIRRFENSAFSIQSHAITAPEALSVLKGYYKVPKNNVETHVIEIINDIEKAVGLHFTGDPQNKIETASNLREALANNTPQEGIGAEERDSISDEIPHNARLMDNDSIAQSSIIENAKDWKGWSYKNPKGTRLQP